MFRKPFQICLQCMTRAPDTLQILGGLSPNELWRCEHCLLLSDPRGSVSSLKPVHVEVSPTVRQFAELFHSQLRQKLLRCLFKAFWGQADALLKQMRDFSRDGHLLLRWKRRRVVTKARCTLL